jgi:hypothetical protein
MFLGQFAPALAAAAPHPDAELIAACARLRANWRHLGELLEAAGDDDAAWEAASERTTPEWDAAMAIVLSTRATTLAGIFARAATLAETAPLYFDERWLDEGDDEMQRFVLLRDLVALGRASA